jgi:two-component system sensor histidine kinase UhpB
LLLRNPVRRRFPDTSRLSGEERMLEQAVLPAPPPTRPAAAVARRHDFWWVAAATLLSFLVGSALELHESFFHWVAGYERWQADELPLTFTVLATGMAWVAWRRRREAQAELQLRVAAQARADELLAHNRELARQLIAVQESERLALARELHDELGQSCSAIRVEAAYIRLCPPDNRAGVLAAAARADAAAQALYEGVRGLLRRLRPTNLDTLGLVPALQELCTAWQARSGVRCICTHEGLAQPLGDALNITIYRVAQEALTNVLQHAGATTVRVVVARTAADEVRLSVQDDGRGIAAGAATRGLGLLGATERAAALGGALQLRSVTGGGTLLLLRIPLPPAAPPVEAA